MVDVDKSCPFILHWLQETADVTNVTRRPRVCCGVDKMNRRVFHSERDYALSGWTFLLVASESNLPVLWVLDRRYCLVIPESLCNLAFAKCQFSFGTHNYLVDYRYNRTPKKVRCRLAMSTSDRIRRQLQIIQDVT